MIKFLDLKQRLNTREQQGLTRDRLCVDSAQQAELLVEGKKWLNFASNDYLGLANSQAAKSALVSGAEQAGFGSGASHMVCGHHRAHQQLEQALADFTERDAAVTFSSGYMANLAILQTLAQKGDVIIADKLNHASLIDGCRLSEADSLRYPHCDLAALQRRLVKAPQNKFVVTDSVFSMDGDLAPLKEMAVLCAKYNAILVVDDAHGFGVLGENGKGCAEHFGLSQQELPVLMGTLGKALGGYGAFVAGAQELVDYLAQQARSYIYTTAMPAAVASANQANLNELRDRPELITRLKQNIEYFRQQCECKNIPLLDSQTAIQPLLIGGNQRLMAINHRLQQQGVWVGAIRPPTVPVNSARLRITLSAAHSENKIDLLVSALLLALSCSD